MTFMNDFVTEEFSRMQAFLNQISVNKIYLTFSFLSNCLSCMNKSGSEINNQSSVLIIQFSL